MQKKPELATFALKRGKAAAKTPQKPKPFKKKKQPSQQSQAKVMTAKAKKDDDDNPFAILKQLQTGKK